MKLILEDQEKDIFIFEATKEELEVCFKVVHIALERLGEEFNDRTQSSDEEPYETGLVLEKKLKTLLEQHKDLSSQGIILNITIRSFEASIIFNAFNEVCNGLHFGVAHIPTLEQLSGYSREELLEFFDSYEKIYFNRP
ncbi:hypothetical protein [Entomobacter blattae]|uniref:Uncharacterized protein n=1 Tax=Entomobacter blattae TaxID=2762277 RepID=A0A7H1NRL5_9PROT|nr:hypothetical protein [Entomobacter blattae]QNT78425.1 hypothetical protein JGUZn3_11990 [Entomobacter blattae]